MAFFGRYGTPHSLREGTLPNGVEALSFGASQFPIEHDARINVAIGIDKT